MTVERGWPVSGAVCLAVSVLAAINAFWDGPILLKIAVVVLTSALTVLALLFLPRSRPAPLEKGTVSVVQQDSVVLEPRQEIRPVERRVPSEAILQMLRALEEQLAQLPRTNTFERFRSQLETFLAEFRESAVFIYENVIRTFEISDNLANTAKEAFELSEKVQSGVKIVTESLNESQRLAEALFSQSRKISKIVTIMSDISEKIHILSINASIVSARAGMSGKGFEVVAKEIRNLAKETENSLIEIENVIAEVQNTIQNVNEKVELAHKETETEKGALLAVAGSLQGVILAVEIIRAVSSVAKERGEMQVESLNRALFPDDLLEDGTTTQILQRVRSGVEELEHLLVHNEEEER